MSNGRYPYCGLVLTIVLFLGYFAVAQGPDQRKLWNDAYSRLTAENTAFLPNPFLIKIIDGMPPGTALDVAMGQGRNAVMLASRGWDVSGFDISDVAIGQASKVGVKVNGVVADGNQFDYGLDRYDLVVAVRALPRDRSSERRCGFVETRRIAGRRGLPPRQSCRSRSRNERALARLRSEPDRDSL
jgi:SAM-dependent methyltransferase